MWPPRQFAIICLFVRYTVTQLTSNINLGIFHTYSCWMNCASYYVMYLVNFALGPALDKRRCTVSSPNFLEFTPNHRGVYATLPINSAAWRRSGLGAGFAIFIVRLTPGRCITEQRTLDKSFSHNSQCPTPLKLRPNGAIEIWLFYFEI